MKGMAIAAALLASVALLPTAPAHAAGCLKGALVGGAAGHMAGHHGWLGAGAGCAIGHHEANKRARENDQANQHDSHDNHY